MANLKKTKVVSKKKCFKCYDDTFFNKLAQLSQSEVLQSQRAEKQQVKKRKTKKKNITKNVSKTPENAKFCFNSRQDGFFYQNRIVFDKNGKNLSRQLVPIYCTICPKKGLNGLLENGLKNYNNTADFINYKIVSDNEKSFKNDALNAERKKTETAQILTETKKLKNKAASKFFTNQYVKHLAEIESSFLQKSYLSSLECADNISQNGNKLTSRYCKQRWCTICNRIRTAKLLNGYMPQINKFEKPYFLTLTTTNCTAENLPDTITALQNKFRFIYKKIHKKFNVGYCVKNEIAHDLQGIKKIECTYNFKEDTYHPHLHFILKNESLGNEILNEWLKKNEDKQPKYIDKLNEIIYNVEVKKLSRVEKILKDKKNKKLEKFNEHKNLVIDAKAQKLKEVWKTDKMNGAKELFKYFTKIVSKTNEYEYVNIPQKNSIWIENVKKEKCAIVIPAMDIIFRAMYNRRIYEPFGIKAVKEDNFEITAETFEHLKHETISFKWNGIDWMNTNSELLANYSPDANLLSLVENIIY